MTRARARTRTAAGALALVAGATVLAGCSSPQPSATGRSTLPPVTHLPLSTTTAGASGALAVVAMGTLSDPLNTFWQLFFRPPSSSRWTLETPPGVADNGGLVVSTGAGAGSVVAGFEPSQDLVFSPLALSTDAGRSWSGVGLVPGPLAAVPDALASSGTGSLALVRSDAGEVLRSTGDASSWSTLVRRSTLAASAAGRSCAVGEITAVALTSTGSPLVGSTCTTPGVVGIFGRVRQAWRLIGPSLASPTGTSATTVLRLLDSDGEVTALVAVGDGSRVRLTGVSGTGGGGWSRSPSLPLAPGSHIVSTGVSAGGGFVVLAAPPRGPLSLDVETGPGGGWRSLASPPSRTATVVMGSGGVVDALVVALTQLTDWRLDAASGTWSKIDSVIVPIQFGSSS